MKKIITVFIFCFLYGECFSQAGEWVWIKGDSVPNQPGNFGVQGVPSPTNNPPSLYEPCEWTDLNGNFWLFGGLGNIGGNGVGYGDLWKYDPLNNEWTWMKGSGIANDTGNHGLQGIPSPINNPRSSAFGNPSWVDTQGNLWMYGGTNFFDSVYACSNDLWKYDISTNEWTWMKGSNSQYPLPIYGIKGVPNPQNNPGGRTEMATAWTDDNGNLWLFGGRVNYLSGFNDLWRYNISTNEWTWMKGPQLIYQSGNYGSIGIEDPSNIPRSRLCYCRWKDNVGKFWLFGGNDSHGGTDKKLHDLWRYNPFTNNWAWMGGDSLVNSIGNYGIKCAISSNNIPGSRWENRASWKDQNGDFWLFGGFKNSYSFNDLWKYCIANNKWIWIRGDSTTNSLGHWGTLGIANSANEPNARGGAVAWSDNDNHLYLFGGWGIYNDLWKYTIDTTCGVCPTSTSIAENNFTNELLVFPNPTNSSLTISFSTSEKQTVELRIYNTLGKQIYFTKEGIIKGKFEKEIHVEKWSDGIYFLQLKTNEGNLNRKVVVQH